VTINSREGLVIITKVLHQFVLKVAIVLRNLTRNQIFKEEGHESRQRHPHEKVDSACHFNSMVRSRRSSDIVILISCEVTADIFVELVV
jgi:hypothetical protein